MNPESVVVVEDGLYFNDIHIHVVITMATS